MRSTSLSSKQTAITKHPERHGSYCLRVMFTNGATMEIVSQPLPFKALIASLQDRIVDLQRIEGGGVASGPADALVPNDQGDHTSS